MAWYRTGTVTVTNGSATVTGVGTDFVSNVMAGDGFRGPDGRTCEISRVVSATELALAEGYNGPTAGGQGYTIQPTQSYIRDLARAAATLLATFGAVRDGVGQGLFGDGTLAAPGLRFLADPDTGLARYFDNAVVLVTGGTGRLWIDSRGFIGLGGQPTYQLDVHSPSGPYIARLRNGSTDNDQYAVTVFQQGAAGSPVGYFGTGGSAVSNSAFRSNVVFGSQTAHPLVFSTADTERARIDPAGNLLVGVTSAARHTISKGTVQGTPILDIFTSALFFAVQGAAPNAAACAVGISVNTTTGRSINAAGTVNASGADYAEYMTKAAGCGTIAPGDVCGVDQDGKLTRTWADARSFVVKSTDPAYVGGDTWAAGMAARPKAPSAEPIAPAALPTRPVEDGPELDSWRVLADAYPAALAQWQAEHAAWQAASDAYDRDLPVWEAALEAERVKVDRIAFCGQVPVNVTGDFEVGDYLIAAAAGAGIKAIAIAEGAITFDQYRRRLGKVWAVRGGRAWVDLQHG